MAQGTAATIGVRRASKRLGPGVCATVSIAVLLCVAGYAALFVAPSERTMGLIQRIFYFHAPSWWSGFIAFGIVAVANIGYLWKRNPKWDWLAVSAAEIGVAFITIGLITGPIWAHPVWGIWWTWDARLTSAFALWVLFVCYLMLRSLVDDSERRAVFSAVFGIFAAVDIPFVYFSIWFFRTQHPQPVIGDGGSLDPRMWDVTMVCWAALLGVLLLLLRQRYRLEALRHEVQELRVERDRGGTG
jgi:heme exporter protein C